MLINNGKTDKLVAAMETSSVNGGTQHHVNSGLSCRAGTRGERSHPSGPVGVPAEARGFHTPHQTQGSVRPLSVELPSALVPPVPQEAGGRRSKRSVVAFDELEDSREA